MAQALVGQLIDADLCIRARVADLEAHDLPGGGVRSQRRRGVHMQAPLPHPEQVNATHVGQARSQATEAYEQRAQVFLGSLQDDIDREVASRRR